MIHFFFMDLNWCGACVRTEAGVGPVSLFFALLTFLKLLFKENKETRFWFKSPAGFIHLPPDSCPLQFKKKRNYLHTK